MEHLTAAICPACNTQDSMAMEVEQASHTTELTSEKLAEIRKRYTTEPVPECHICGGELTLQRAGGGSLAYACTGVTYDEDGAHYAPGRNIADDHYAQSRWVTRGGDSDVLVLLDALEAKDARIAALENDEVRQRLANAEHQLYMSELAKNNLRASRMAQFKKRRDAERRADEMQSRAEAAERRAAELVSSLRPVGVMSQSAYNRLENRESRFIALWPRPEIYLPRKRPDDGVIVYARTSADIQIQGGE